METRWVDVLAESELPVGAQKVIWIGHSRVLLCRTQTALHAVADLCSHALRPLSGGRVDAGTIQCPKHGARFDLASGQSLSGIAKKPIRVYVARVDAGKIQIEWPSP